MAASGMVPEAYGSEFGDDDSVQMEGMTPGAGALSVSASAGIGSNIGTGWYMWGVPVGAIVGLFLLAIWFRKG
jgi:hypothetical protein